jgi:hypothetical protein
MGENASSHKYGTSLKYKKRDSLESEDEIYNSLRADQTKYQKNAF